MIESEESRSSAWILCWKFQGAYKLIYFIRIDGQHLFVMQSKLKLPAECSKCMTNNKRNKLI